MIGLLVLAMAADVASNTVSDNPDNVVRCVREEITGSLARTRRVCHTVGEWRQIHKDADQEAARFRMSGTLNGLNNDPDPNARAFQPGTLAGPN